MWAWLFSWGGFVVVFVFCWVFFLFFWGGGGGCCFNPTVEVVTFRLLGWCMLGMLLLPAFTRLGHVWKSGSLESVRWNVCVHRHDLSLYSHRKDFWGNGVRAHDNSKGKNPLYRRLRGGSNPRHCMTRIASPTHYRLSYSAPLPPPPPPPPPPPIPPNPPPTSTMATHSGAWCYRVSAGTSLPGVSMRCSCDTATLIYDFLSVIGRRIVWADPSLRSTARVAWTRNKQETTVVWRKQEVLFSVKCCRWPGFERTFWYQFSFVSVALSFFLPFFLSFPLSFRSFFLYS